MKNPTLIGNALLRPGACLAWIALLLVSLFPHAAWAKGERVLFISSYHPGFPTFFQQINGLRSVLEPAGVLLDAEFMDTKRFSGTDNKALFLEHLRFKLEKLPAYDAFVVADDAALRFALEHREDVFAGKPLVFCGVNDQDLAHTLSGASGITGVIESVSLRETLESLWRVVPGLRTVYALVDAEPGGQGDLRTYLAQRDFLVGKNLQVLRLDAMTWDELGDRLSQLRQDEAILLLSAYRDRDNTTKSFEDSLKFILDHARVPVAHLWEHGLGQGILGGKLISHTEQGRIAGQLALKILAGTPAASLPVVEGNEANRHVYDHAALTRFGIRESSLPQGSEVRGKPFSILSQYGTEILVAVVLLITLIALVAALISHIIRLRLAKKLIADSEKRYKALFDANADGILAADKTGQHFIFANPAVCRMFGYSEEEFCALSVKDIHPSESLEEVFANFNAQASGNKDIAEALPCLRRDGSVFLADVRNFTLETDGTSYAVGLFRDVTERKAMEKELVSVRDAALAASVAKSAFLANMSHEIRTPLNGVIGMLQVLETSTLTEEQKEHVSMALSSGRRLTLLLSDILDISRIEAGKLTLTPRPFDIAELQASITALFSIPAQNKGLDLFVEFDEKLPRSLVGDELRLRQIIFNLVGNAIKFTTAGHVRLQFSRLPGSRAHECRVLCCVSDSGDGIANHILPGIFEPFVQGEGSYVRRHQGAGLGLSIVARLVHMMDGTLAIDSGENGTTICFSLSLEPSEPDPKQIQTPGEGQPESCNLRILLAEDDAANMYAAERLLKKAGHDVTQAFDGGQVLALLREKDFDLILMDIQMPVMDGVQATDAIRSDTGLGRKSRIPIIAMTAYAMGGDREKFLARGMDGYVAKPLDAKGLCEAIGNVLSRKRA